MAAQKSLNEDYKSDGKWKEIWRRFKKNKGAVIGAGAAGRADGDLGGRATVYLL